jgi:hypothetical protein
VTVQLNDREAFFLNLIHPVGTIGTGTSIGKRLYKRGLVSVVKFGRYGITDMGAGAIIAWRKALAEKLAQEKQGNLL